jgi:HD-GYP domain-containing protein (c-di-GMP phosphodiesterase class II)
MASRVTSEGPGRDVRRPGAAELQSLRYAEDVRRLYRQLQRAICQSLLGLANALEAKDPYTRGHSERVGAWGRRLATALGLAPADVETVVQAGLLHDIGKIGIPETVLRKRGPLDPAEWALMYNHPIIGAQIVAPSSSSPPARSSSVITTSAGTAPATPTALPVRPFRSARASSRWPTSSMP